MLCWHTYHTHSLDPIFFILNLNKLRLGVRCRYWEVSRDHKTDHPYASFGFQVDGWASVLGSCCLLNSQCHFRTVTFLSLLFFPHFVVHGIMLVRSVLDTNAGTSKPCIMIWTFFKNLRSPEVSTASLIYHSIFH